MKLFKYEDFVVTISEEALSIKPFKMIWNRDRSKYKERAILELSFIYFYCDPRSDFSFITNLEDKANEIKSQIGLEDKWKPDKVVEEGMTVYEALTKTTSSLLLEDTREAINKLRTVLREIDMTEVDDKGKPRYALNTITSTIKQIPALIEDLAKAEKSIAREIEDNTRMRGQGVKKLYEDGIDL